MRLRVILADDHCMFAQSLGTLLSRTFDVVGVVHGGSELLGLLQQRPADCLLLDLLLPDGCGLDLLPAIHRLQPRLRVIVVTMMVDRVLAEAALAGGAHGFVPKHAQLAELVTAINDVSAGNTYLSPLVPKSSHCVSLGAQHLGLHRLTPRQQQVVLLMGEGRSGMEICDRLGLSPSTVTFHKHNIMRVLGMDSEAGLLRYAVLVRAGTSER